MENFQSAGPIRVTQSELGIQLDWHGSDSQQLRLLIAVEAGEPVIKSLQLQAGDDQWTTLLTDSRFEYKIVEGLRRISNQQLNPLRELAVEFSDEVIERHKWDAFWDAPLDLRQQEFRGNPPPMDGVASQPGLPRSVSEVRRADISYNVKSCRVVADGARVELIFPDVSLGSFTGEFILALYEGSNLIRTEVLADTQLPSVAYKYDVGITGLDVQVAGSVSWRDTGGLMQRYQLNGPVNADQVVLQAANRLVVAETNGGAIADFNFVDGLDLVHRSA